MTDGYFDLLQYIILNLLSDGEQLDFTKIQRWQYYFSESDIYGTQVPSNFQRFRDTIHL